MARFGLTDNGKSRATISRSCRVGIEFSRIYNGKSLHLFRENGFLSCSKSRFQWVLQLNWQAFWPTTVVLSARNSLQEPLVDITRKETSTSKKPEWTHEPCVPTYQRGSIGEQTRRTFCKIDTALGENILPIRCFNPVFSVTLQAHEICRGRTSVALGRAFHLFRCRRLGGNDKGRLPCTRAVG